MKIETVEKKKTLMVRQITQAAKLPEVMGEVYGELAAYMEKEGIDFAGPPYAMYYNMDMEALDVEVGFPVSGNHSGDGRIKKGELPEGKIATAVHTGPYDRLEETYNALTAFVKEKGVIPHEWMYEFYLNSPAEVKPEELQTQICFPLK